MEDLVETVTRGNVTEVKVLLASVILALAVYQLVLIAVAYRKVRPRFLSGRAAALTHRASGDAIVVLLGVVAIMCLSIGFEDDATVHAVASAILTVVLGLKILVIRRWHGLGRFLPPLGVTVFLLLAVAWITSAGDFLAEA